MRRPSARLFGASRIALVTASAVAFAPACSEAEPAPPPLPSLSAYDRGCARASDCEVVPGEGCASCEAAALNANSASGYSATLAAAKKSPTCREVLATAEPCVAVEYVAACEGAVCIAKVKPAGTSRPRPAGDAGRADAADETDGDAADARRD